MLIVITITARNRLNGRSAPITLPNGRHCREFSQVIEVQDCGWHQAAAATAQRARLALERFQPGHIDLETGWESNRESSL